MARYKVIIDGYIDIKNDRWSGTTEQEIVGMLTELNSNTFIAFFDDDGYEYNLQYDDIETVVVELDES